MRPSTCDKQPAWDFPLRRPNRANTYEEELKRTNNQLSKPKPKQQISHPHTTFHQNTEFRHTHTHTKCEEKKKGKKTKLKFMFCFHSIPLPLLFSIFKNILVSYNLDVRHLFSSLFFFRFYMLFFIRIPNGTPDKICFTNFIALQQLSFCRTFTSELDSHWFWFFVVVVRLLDEVYKLKYFIHLVNIYSTHEYMTAINY